MEAQGLGVKVERHAAYVTLAQNLQKMEGEKSLGMEGPTFYTPRPAPHIPHPTPFTLHPTLYNLISRRAL